MLTVPQEIKDLLHLDTCQKNIRIHFPNGERSDVCNDLIVQNSVKFTESLCSQDELKFGLCESPVFECETVGVGNIKGATIEVSCEIYCEPTVSGAEFKTDIQHYVYAIPYGRFIVSDCKRQADMIHRRIVAYGGTSAGHKDISNPVEVLKDYLQQPSYSSITYEADSFLLALSNIGSNKWSNTLFSATDLTVSPSTRSDISLGRWKYNGQTVDFRAYGYYSGYNGNNTTQDSLLSIDGELQENLLKDIIDDVINTFKAYDLPAEFYDYTKWRKRFNRFLLAPSFLEQGRYDELPLLCYPYLSSSIGFCSVRVFYNIEYFTLDYYPPGSGGNIATLYVNEDIIKNITAKKLDVIYPGLLGHKTLFENVLFIPFGTAYTRRFLPPKDWDNLKTLNSILELNGLFGYITKDNAFSVINLKRQFGLLPNTTLYPGLTLYPDGVLGGSIKREDYQSCWYDDEYEKPFGAVQCTYKDSNNDEQIVVLYLSGFSSTSDRDTYKTYDFSDNEIIQGSTWAEADIQAYCQKIASNIEGVTYMPVDFVGRGLPYVEAGDTFEILTRSNDSITTIVLNKTTSGEQTLTDSYKSV